MGRAIPLSETTFVVVDIETTGSIPAKHAITEIGAIKVRQGQVVERFVQLINPQQDIPPFIQKLTGITPRMVENAPTMIEVLPAFLDFLGDDVFVAHHVPFDFGFINAVSKALLGKALENTQVCTCQLARKLLPALKRKNLDAVSHYFEIAIKNRHRAMGDAEATAQVLIQFLAMLEDQGITTLAKLLQYQKRGAKGVGPWQSPFPAHRLAQFTQQPGVYLMRDEKGEILYIGKAKQLRRRLQSYFNNPFGQPPKVQELIRQVCDIETRVLGSELEALLEEAALIKQHQPYYNRQIKNYKSFPFLQISVQNPYPQLRVATDIDADQALYFGPYTRKRRLADLVESLSKVFQLRSCSDKVFQYHQKLGSPCLAYQIGTCSGPCVAKISRKDYAAQVHEIIRFLEGHESELTLRMAVQRDAYAEALAFEKAQRIQDRLLELLKLQANTQFLAHAVHHNNVLITLPDHDPGQALLIYVHQGRPIFKQVFHPATGDIGDILDRVRLLQDMQQSQGQDPPPVLIQKSELEEIRIIAQWLRQEHPEENAAVWDLTQPVSRLALQLEEYFANQAAGAAVPLLLAEQAV